MKEICTRCGIDYTDIPNMPCHKCRVEVLKLKVGLIKEPVRLKGGENYGQKK